ncbi:MAG: hypothetical protein MdMp014T_0335 [Treponematales bacterium]
MLVPEAAPVVSIDQTTVWDGLFSPATAALNWSVPPVNTLAALPAVVTVTLVTVGSGSLPPAPPPGQAVKPSASAKAQRRARIVPPSPRDESPGRPVRRPLWS